ncbi:MAG: SDR family NAD(P)-dependent oxidoreductase [Bacteroidetes bacterium]|nr:SDR family NAD(P)-dependent oxidoreductase [Bacteroidota bacterium]MDA0888440.1 SDR family NAD(P)-dependent oxidoreductase [Bacteroidota bacterium]MDA1084500.1 SDR family NAD(P)-dependent oxidoreductase [Bacteroidota bacterium]
MNKHIVITGVSTGIGRDALDVLHKKDYHIFGSVRKVEDAERLAKKYPDRFTPLIFDVQNHDAVIKASKVVFEQCSSLDGLINNAGIAVPGPMQHLSEVDFERQLDINLKAVRRITNLFLPLLGATANFEYSPGRIINISSVSGLFNSPFNGAYSISKHALESMTDIYRRELRRYGIQVIAIEPGPIKTDIWQKNLNSMEQYAETDYFDVLQKADKMIENAEKSALPVSRISNLILKCLTIKHPKTRYIVHRNRLFFKLLAYYFPDKLVDWFIHKTLTSGNKHRPI